MTSKPNAGLSEVAFDRSLMEFLRVASTQRGMYFGDLSAYRLEAVLEGWKFALMHLRFSDTRFRLFEEWLDRKHGPTGPVHALYRKAQMLGDEAAFTWFFDELEVYLGAESQAT